MSHPRCLVPVLLAAFLLGGLAAQPPIVLNTTVRSFTLTSVPVADVWTYIDPIGREFALVCGRNSGFEVYDVTNPDAPVFAESIPTTGSDLKDVKVAGNDAYICQEAGDALIVDLADAYNISVVGTVPGIGAHNGEVGNGLWVFASVSCGSRKACRRSRSRQVVRVSGPSLSPRAP